jgi:hypothetical protein
MPQPRARVGAAAVAVVVLLATGCGAGATPGEPSVADRMTPSAGRHAAGPAPVASASAAALEVGVEYPRYLQTRRRLEITVVNNDDVPVTVTRLTLRAPQFAPTPPIRKDAVIAPGRRVDLQTDFGAADCAADDDAPAVADLRLRRDGGPAVDATVALPTAALADIHADECGQQAVREAIELSLGLRWQRSGRALRGDVVLRRRPGAAPESVIVAGVGGNVIFTVEPVGGDAGLPRMSPDDAMARLPVEMVASRCDPHAVAESKKTYLFPLWIALGDAPAQYMTIDAESSLRPQLDALIDECIQSQAAS